MGEILDIQKEKRQKQDILETKGAEKTFVKLPPQTVWTQLFSESEGQDG